MNSPGEVWIALVDSHERGSVEGAWSLMVPKLEAASDGPRPIQIIAEERIRGCLRNLAVEESIVTPAEGRLPRRSPLFASDTRDGIESLMVLAASMKPAQPSAIRTFGLRAGIVGRVLADMWSVPMKATLASLASDTIHDHFAAGRETRHRSRLSLENWIASGSAEVETLTKGQAADLRRRVLADRTDIHAFDEWPHGDGTRSPTRELIAVLASEHNHQANEVILRILATLRIQHPDLWIVWLARRGSLPSMRAVQDFRRFDLASTLTWEDEPWMRPPWRAETPWDLLLVVGGDACAPPSSRTAAPRPLTEAARAARIPVVALSPGEICTTAVGKIEAALSFKSRETIERIPSEALSLAPRSCECMNDLIIPSGPQQERR